MPAAPGGACGSVPRIDPALAVNLSVMPRPVYTKVGTCRVRHGPDSAVGSVRTDVAPATDGSRRRAETAGPRASQTSVAARSRCRVAGYVRPMTAGSQGLINTLPRPRLLIIGFDDDPETVASLEALCPTVMAARG